MWCSKLFIVLCREQTWVWRETFIFCSKQIALASTHSNELSFCVVSFVPLERESDREALVFGGLLAQKQRDKRPLNCMGGSLYISNSSGGKVLNKLFSLRCIGSTTAYTEQTRYFLMQNKSQLTWHDIKNSKIKKRVAI